MASFETATDKHVLSLKIRPFDRQIKQSDEILFLEI